MIYAHTHITININNHSILFLISIVCCLLLVGCSAPSSSVKPTTEQVSSPTPVPDQTYKYMFSVTEINGQYYEFPDYNKYGVITVTDEHTILPNLTELGSTTRTASSFDYPDKDLQSNCLPNGIRIFYNEQEDKFAFFDDQNEGYWSYSGVYKIYDKSEMNTGKTYYSFEYTDHVRYSNGWLREQYHNTTKVLGLISALSDGGITIKNAEIKDEKLSYTGESSDYECFQPDIFTLYEDTNQYRKGHVFSIQDVDPNTAFCFCIKGNQVIAIVEVAGN